MKKTEKSGNGNYQNKRGLRFSDNFSNQHENYGKYNHNQQ